MGGGAERAAGGLLRACLPAAQARVAGRRALALRRRPACTPLIARRVGHLLLLLCSGAGHHCGAHYRQVPVLLVRRVLQPGRHKRVRYRPHNEQHTNTAGPGLARSLCPACTRAAVVPHLLQPRACVPCLALLTPARPALAAASLACWGPSGGQRWCQPAHPWGPVPLACPTPPLPPVPPATRRYWDPNGGEFDAESGTWTGGTVYEPFCDGVCSQLNNVQFGGAPCAACTSAAGCTACPAGAFRVPDCSLNFNYRQYIGSATTCGSKCEACGLACQVRGCSGAGAGGCAHAAGPLVTRQPACRAA